MKKFLVVYEFADRQDTPFKDRTERLWAYTEENLRRLSSGAEYKSFHGFLQGKSQSRKNGLHIGRFLNFLYMHIARPFKILFSRADIVFARTTPPPAWRRSSIPL